jgi:hypothetical protein
LAKYTLILLFLFPLLSTSHVQEQRTGSCTIGGRAAQNYSFIDQTTLNIESEYAPFLLNYQPLADYYINRVNAQYRDNVVEWRSRFCSYADSADVAYLIYKAPIEEISDLYNAADNKRRDINYTLQNNQFARLLKESGCKEVIKYLIFAKRCEPFVSHDPDGEGKISVDTAMMKILIKQGRDEFRQTSSYFVKLRYIYQTMRMAHYVKDYPIVLKLYDDMMPKMEKVNSIINYWILGHKAGALMHTGQRIQAAYLYSTVFCYCPSKRAQAYQSFDIRTDEEFRLCLTLCKNDFERSALYAIRASGNNNKSLSDMKIIYGLSPKSEQLELLLMKDVIQLERILLGKDFRRQKYTPKTQEKALIYLDALRQFVKSSADHNQVRSPALWRGTEGYLTLLTGDWIKARQIFFIASQMTDDPNVRKQLMAYDLAARIAGLQNLQDTTTIADIESIKAEDVFIGNDDFEGYLKEKLGFTYRQSGHKGMAFMSDYEMKDLHLNPNQDVIDDLIEICKKTNKTPYEKELVFKNVGQKTIINELLELKGTYHLNRYELEAAAEALKQIPVPDQPKNRFNPFVERIRDCSNCNAIDTVTYNKVELVDRLRELEFQAHAALSNGAPYYYQLGLAYYNMSYFGNSWAAMDYFRSSTSWKTLNKGNPIFPQKENPLGNIEHTDCSHALAYFEKARLMTKDIELGAKCTFMAAKCEQNAFYISKDNQYTVGSKLMPSVPPQYRNYYYMLATYYGRTAYCKQVVNECKYFKYYSKR